MDEQNYQNDYQYGNPVVEEPEKKGTDTLAIVSLVLGILAIILGCCSGVLGVILGIAGIICAVLSKKNGKSGMATAGLICSIAGIVIGIAMVVISVIFAAQFADIYAEMLKNQY